MKEKIYVFGHKKPDTDSVCSAISLAYLKQELGVNAEARILSDINDETRYVLNKFKVEIPKILNDVKLQVSDVAYHKNFKINVKESVYNAFFTMQRNNMSSIPVVDDNEVFLGSFAMKDIAKQEILGDNESLVSNYTLIQEVLEAEEILKFDDDIKGNIINLDLEDNIVNYTKELNENSILIVGNRKEIIREAINNKVKLIIVTNGFEISKDDLEIADNNKINVLYTKKSTFETLLKIGFTNYIENYRFTKNLVCVNENTFVTELNDIINKTKHSYYPVIDSENKCLGLIKLADLQDYQPKQVMLVDHNEIDQSAYGLDEADIIDIVDHHKLGNMGTNQPINFRNMTVGSTCTIVYELFKENNIDIPEHIAGLLLSGIISDTLYMKSPTTTKHDERVLKELLKMTNINGEEFAIEMFKANDAIVTKSIDEIIYMDFKTFPVDSKMVAVGQVTTLNSEFILKNIDEYIKVLNRDAINNNYDVFMFCITDIFKNGSYIIYNDDAKVIIEDAFGNNLEQGAFIEELVSRKKQVVPALMKAIK